MKKKKLETMYEELLQEIIKMFKLTNEWLQKELKDRPEDCEDD